MSLTLEQQEFWRAATGWRDAVRAAMAGRMENNGDVAAAAHGLAAYLGDLAAVVAKPGQLDRLLEMLTVTMRANADAMMTRRATTPEAGHG